MRKLIVGIVLGLMLALTPLAPAEAREHVFIGVGIGGYYPYPAPYPYGYPYYSPYYVAPPPTVVYAPAIVAPPVVAPVYAAPAPVVAPAPAPIVEDQPISANQTSPTFIDSQGRTCRHFQSTNGGPAFGTACLQSDGSWRTIQ